MRKLKAMWCKLFHKKHYSDPLLLNSRKAQGYKRCAKCGRWWWL